MKWTETKNYHTPPGGYQHVQVVLTREDGKVIRSTWWGICDGSAECEADAFRREFEKKEAEEKLKSAALTMATIEDDEPLPSWDARKCSCHISPPCPYCESGEYQV